MKWYVIDTAPVYWYVLSYMIFFRDSDAGLFIIYMPTQQTTHYLCLERIVGKSSMRQLFSARNKLDSLVFVHYCDHTKADKLVGCASAICTAH